MQLRNKVIVVTGGASGIGRAMCRRFAAEVAEAAVKGLADERFLILPHPEVAEYFRHKAADYDRWLRGMRRLQAGRQSPKVKSADP